MMSLSAKGLNIKCDCNVTQFNVPLSSVFFLMLSDVDIKMRSVRPNEEITRYNSTLGQVIYSPALPLASNSTA